VCPFSRAFLYMRASTSFVCENAFFQTSVTRVAWFTFYRYDSKVATLTTTHPPQHGIFALKIHEANLKLKFLPARPTSLGNTVVHINSKRLLPSSSRLRQYATTLFFLHATGRRYWCKWSHRRCWLGGNHLQEDRSVYCVYVTHEKGIPDAIFLLAVHIGSSEVSETLG
jgi:hypothetical protein